MTRNKGLRLLALIASLFMLTPIILAPAFFGLPIPLALFVGFVIWALLTLLIGNIFIAVWGTEPPAPVRLTPEPIPPMTDYGKYF
jgi:hypothetical protein